MGLLNAKSQLMKKQIKVTIMTQLAPDYDREWHN